MGGQKVVVTQGELFEVTAVDLVSGGYRWVVTDLPDGLGLVADDASAARRTFRLRADRAGSYDLRLSLVRPWEPPDLPPAATRTVRVQVEPPAS